MLLEVARTAFIDDEVEVLMIVVVLRDVEVVADLVPETTLETMFELAITLLLGTPEVETELVALDEA